MRSSILLGLSIAPLACAGAEPPPALPAQAPAAPPAVVDLAQPPEPQVPSQAAAAADPADPHLSREASLREAATFGLIGVVPADGTGNGPPPAHGPRLRGSAISGNGPLAPEVVHRAVHQGFPRFRACYEKGLQDNPSLQGKVVLKLVIEQDGTVAVAADGGSDLPHRGVIQCMTREAVHLSFPRLEGSRLTLLYPIVLDPGNP